MNEKLSIIVTCAIILMSFSIILYNLVVPRFTLREYLFMLGGLFASFFIFFLINQDLTFIIVYIVPCFYIYHKKKNILSSIGINAFAFIIYLVSDCIIYKIITVCFNIKIDMYGVNYFVIEGIFSLLAIVLSIFLGKLINKKELDISDNNKSKYILLIYTIVIIIWILICICINKGDGKFESSQGALAVFYITLMFIILGILVVALNKENKLKNQQIQYKNLEEYTAKLEALYTDMRKFRHDYINILSSMWGFIDDNNMSGLRDYFKNNIQPLNVKINSNNYKLGLLKNIHIPEIKGLVSSKVIKAQELGIDVFIDIMEPIDKIEVDIVEMVRSLGIILDNAIEASICSEEKNMAIGFIKKNNSVIILVSNSFSGDIPPIHKLYRLGFSTKGENRGLGLSNLREIMSKYNNVAIDTRIEGKIFLQEITISNK